MDQLYPCINVVVCVIYLLDVVTKEDIHSTTPRTLHYIKWRMDKRNTSHPPNP